MSGGSHECTCLTSAHTLLLLDGHLYYERVLNFMHAKVKPSLVTNHEESRQEEERSQIMRQRKILERRSRVDKMNCLRHNKSNFSSCFGNFGTCSGIHRVEPI